jgi:hypothetical protein
MAENPLTDLLPKALATLDKHMNSQSPSVAVKAANSVLDRIPETQTGGGAPVVQAAVFVQGGNQASEMVDALVGFLGKLDGPAERDVTPPAKLSTDLPVDPAQSPSTIEEDVTPKAVTKPKTTPKKKPRPKKPAVPKYVKEDEETVDDRIARELGGMEG